MIKLKWVTAPAPVGKFRSFDKRGWPQAKYEGEYPALMIICNDPYSSKLAKSGNHGELTVSVACWPAVRDQDKAAFAWRTLKARFKTLDEAKAAGLAFLDKHPEHRHPTAR